MTTASQALILVPCDAFPALADGPRVTYELLLALAWQHDRKSTPPMTLPELAALRRVLVRTLLRHLAQLQVAGLVAPAPDVAEPQRAWLPRHLADASSAAAGVVRRLVEAGVYPGLAQQLAHLPWVTLEVVDAWIAALRAERGVRQVGGLLVGILRNRERCLPPPGPRHEPAASAESPTPARSVRRTTRRRPQEDAAWARVLERLRAMLSEDEVRMLLAGSHPISLDERVLVVAVKSPYAVDWFRNQRLLVLNEAASAEWGRSVTVRLTLARNDV